MEKDSYTCVFCEGKFFGYGNNPEPIRSKGRCCDDCNISKVIPARLIQVLRMVKKGENNG